MPLGIWAPFRALFHALKLTNPCSTDRYKSIVIYGKETFLVSIVKPIKCNRFLLSFDI